MPTSVKEQTDGVLNRFCPRRFRDITDGLSRTMFFSERATGQIEDALRPVPDPLGANWAICGQLEHTLYVAMYPPNPLARGDRDESAVRYAPSSEHPGGVHVCFGDGSVTFVSDAIDSWDDSQLKLQQDGSWFDVPRRGVWQALATRAGGEAESL